MTKELQEWNNVEEICGALHNYILQCKEKNIDASANGFVRENKNRFTSYFWRVCYTVLIEEIFQDFVDQCEKDSIKITEKLFRSMHPGTYKKIVPIFQRKAKNFGINDYCRYENWLPFYLATLP